MCGGWLGGWLGGWGFYSVHIWWGEIYSLLLGLWSKGGKVFSRNERIFMLFFYTLPWRWRYLRRTKEGGLVRWLRKILFHFHSFFFGACYIILSIYISINKINKWSNFGLRYFYNGTIFFVFLFFSLHLLFVFPLRSSRCCTDWTRTQTQNGWTELNHCWILNCEEEVSLWFCSPLN